MPLAQRAVALSAYDQHSALRRQSHLVQVEYSRTSSRILLSNRGNIGPCTLFFFEVFHHSTSTCREFWPFNEEARKRVTGFGLDECPVGWPEGSAVQHRVIEGLVSLELLWNSRVLIGSMTNHLYSTSIVNDTVRSGLCLSVHDRHRDMK